MAKDTKERILDTAFEMIADKGYAGMNVRELSEALGLSKAAMYRHFRSKEDLWQTLLVQAAAHYDSRFGSAERLPPVPASCGELAEITLTMIDFTIHDRKIILMRKIIQQEQFRSEHIRDLATRYFLTGTEALFTGIFDGMMKNGLLRPGDPGMLAFAYTAPVTALIHLCDRDPAREPEILEKIKAFIRHFIDTYAVQG